MWKGAGVDFPSQFPSYPEPGDCVYLYFSGALEVGSFGSPRGGFIHSYIYSGVIYAFG